MSYSIPWRREKKEKGVRDVTNKKLGAGRLISHHIFGVLIEILNLDVLAKMINKYSCQLVSLICLTVSAAHLVNIVCLLVYSMIRLYHIIPLNWIATMSVSFTNWSMLRYACMWSLMDIFTHNWLDGLGIRWFSSAIIPIITPVIIKRLAHLISFI